MDETSQDTLDFSALMGFLKREGESCQTPWASKISGRFAYENGEVCDAYDHVVSTPAIVPRAKVSLA